MEWPSFQVQVPGKWVLAGEHAVLRGASAVALPHPEHRLNLSFKSQPGLGKVAVEPMTGSDTVEELLASVQDAWQGEGRSFKMPEGVLTLDSSIPIGAGLGSSAALCVAFSRWFAEPLNIPKEQLDIFATQLEHRFHGRSSGMDVAVIAANEPISFTIERGAQVLGVRKLPKFTFHDTKVRCRTSECVLRVEKFREADPRLALQVDEAMGTASRIAMEGLVRFDAGDFEEGRKIIQRAMAQARECYYSWQLVPAEARHLEEDLLKKGAMATKLTGAGGGGFVVALWES